MTRLLLPLLALTMMGCGVTTQPLRELVPPENVEDLDDPEAPYYKAMSGYSVGSAILAPGDITTVDFGLGAVLGVSEEFEEHVEVRALLAADPSFPLITRAVMALFMVPEFPEGPPRR